MSQILKMHSIKFKAPWIHTPGSPPSWPATPTLAGKEVRLIIISFSCVLHANSPATAVGLKHHTVTQILVIFMFIHFLFALKEAALPLLSLPQFLNSPTSKHSLLWRPTLNCFRSRAWLASRTVNKLKRHKRSKKTTVHRCAGYFMWMCRKQKTKQKVSSFPIVVKLMLFCLSNTFKHTPLILYVNGVSIVSC